MTAPFNARYDGDIFRPMGRYAAECKAWFKDGQIVRLDQIQERSMASHNHQFAWLAEAWKQLPESISDEFPTPEHLRKRALIQAGYYHETAIEVGSNKAAIAASAEFRKRCEFSVIIVRGPFVIIRDPMSQKKALMGAKVFQESKQRVLEIVADLIGVAPEELTRESAREA